MTDFLIGTAIAALAGMGIGGGGLLVIWLVLIRGMPSTAAQGINLLFFILSAACALPVHRKRRILPRPLIGWLLLAAVPGVFLGCRLADCLSQDDARRCFGYFLLLSGLWQMLRTVRGVFSRHR